MSEGVIDKPAHRVYHGVADDRGGTNARILVMASGGGPTQRKQATVLYQLEPRDPFWWGYSGGSPRRAGAAILDDVLPDAVPALALADMPRELLYELRMAFVDDLLAHFHDGKEFWLSARAAVCWVHGYLELRFAELGKVSEPPS